jgi:hypothetical protein
MDKPEAELFQDWKQHPVSKLLMVWAERNRYSLMDSWASGEFSASFEAEMIARNHAAIGACSVYQDLMDLTVDELYGDDDGKQVRT